MLHFVLLNLFLFASSQVPWTQNQKLVANNGMAIDWFGISVSTYQNYTIIGSPFATVGQNKAQGAAYMFYYNGEVWEQSQQLVADDGVVNDFFGSSVSIYEKYAIVGSYFASVGNNANQGCAYVFHHNGRLWLQKQKLVASDNLTNGFGFTVFIYKNYIFVSANYGDNGNLGTAYIFQNDNNLWIQQQKLISSDPWYETFGFSFSAYGNYAFIGAPNSKIGNNTSQGGVYVFYNNGTLWNQFQKLNSTDGIANDNFGYSISMYENHAIIGADRKGVGSAMQQGTSYIFFNNGKTWHQSQILITNDGNSYDYFGCSSSMYRNYAIVGACDATVANNLSQGAAYVFYNNGTSWVQQQKLVANDGDANDWFGYSVSIYENSIIIGSYLSTVQNNFEQGSAYFYKNNKSI